MQIRSLDEEVAFTREWWERTIKVETKLIAWLRKLHGTEVGGYEDYQRFKEKFQPEERTSKIFTNIANDELKHGGIIVDVLTARGYILGTGAPHSIYWEEMDANIVDLESAAAVNYFGEALAAFRFEVIAEHKTTPGDIKEMLGLVLPDEQFHRETLRRMISDETHDRFKQLHLAAVERLKGT